MSTPQEGTSGFSAMSAKADEIAEGQAPDQATADAQAQADAGTATSPAATAGTPSGSDVTEPQPALATNAETAAPQGSANTDTKIATGTSEAPDALASGSNTPTPQAGDATTTTQAGTTAASPEGAAASQAADSQIGQTKGDVTGESRGTGSLADDPSTQQPNQLSAQMEEAPVVTDPEANKTATNPHGAAVETNGSTADALAHTGAPINAVKKPLPPQPKVATNPDNPPGVVEAGTAPSQVVQTAQPTVTAQPGTEEEAEQQAAKHAAHQDTMNTRAAASSNLEQGARAAESGARHNEAVAQGEKKLVNVTTRYRQDPLALDAALEEAEAQHGEGTRIIPEAYHDLRLPLDAAQRRKEAIGRIAGAHPDTIPTPGRSRVPMNSGSEPEDQDTAPVTDANPVGYSTSEEEVARATDKRHVAGSQRKDAGDPAGTGTERADKPVA